MLSSYLIQPAGAMRRRLAQVPDVGGLYALLLNAPDALEPALARASLRLDTLSLGHRPVLYIGATEDSLRRRLKCHLSDDTCRSTFRMSLGAVLADELDLVARIIPGVTYFGFEPDGEQRLSRWIEENVSVAVRPSSQAIAQEKALIASEEPLLNIAGRRDSPSAGVILLLRDRMRGLPFDRKALH